jgi:predicted HAD superfamily Cof-like phosphohydrolase
MMPYYRTNFLKVKVFMDAFGQEVRSEPELPSKEVQDLRVNLIKEELEELIEALDNNDIVEVADALTDILYVTYGAGHAFGINLDDCFVEVQRSNMSKLGEDGKPIYREDGKILKGPGFSEPNLARSLKLRDQDK